RPAPTPMRKRSCASSWPRWAWGALARCSPKSAPRLAADPAAASPTRGGPEREMTTDDGALVARLVQDIVSIDLNEPFTISGGSQAQARIVVVEVTLRDGTVGLGEAAPLAAYDGETLEVASEALSAAASDVTGLDVTRFRHCA